MSADLNTMELGAMANVVYPPLVGLLTLAIYIVGRWMRINNTVLTIICCTANIATGILLYFYD